MLMYLFFRFGKRRAKSETNTAHQIENGSVMTAPNSPFNASEAVQQKHHYDQPFVLTLLLTALIATPLAWVMLRSSEQTANTVVPTLATGLADATALSQKQVERAQRVIATPTGWQLTQVKPGLTAYTAPTAEIPVVQPNASGRVSAAGDSFDGTRFPYLSSISRADLKPIAPGRYVWSGVWKGEGYGRVLNNQGQLVSPREGGADIHLNITWDERVTDPAQPNLTIAVQNNQDRTAQLTNFSAFLNDPNSGETLERKDLGQLPPIYRVTLDSSGRLISESTKTLQPLGTVTFAYHIPPAELGEHLPLMLEAKNQLFDQRLAEIAELEAAGWVVKEVPAPDNADVS